MSANISGYARLGYSEVSDQQPGALGEEFTVIPGDYDAKHDVFVNTNASTVRVKLLKNTSANPLVPGTFVKRDTSGDMAYATTVAVADDPACAVVDPYLKASVPVGGKYLGVIYGETDVKVGAVEIAKGATIKSGAAGVAVANPLVDVDDVVAIAGVMMETGTATALRRAFVDFRAIK